MIPREKIEEVRERADIVQVISEYVPLKRTGRNFLGLCPFHSEKTPSFSVSEEKGIFHCFGCQESGSVITFIMKKEGYTFPEAVKSLAARYGIPIEEGRTNAADPRDAVFRVNKITAEYFSNELKGPRGTKAREYLKQRGYVGEIIEKFALGYAPDRWDGLVRFLEGKGIALELAEKVGVIARKEKRYYDRFRGRLIFPITDIRGRTVAFGGRSLEEAMPKYLNSPESGVFKKGSVLYGLSQARSSITKESSAIVVEGYFDLLALHRCGFTNSVATMGTALTSEHIRGLKGYAGCVYTLFDADEAGRKAAERGLSLFMEAGVPCKVVTLPQGSDPDDFLKSSGPQALREALASAVPLMEFRLKELGGRFNLKTPDGKASYLDTVIPDLVKIKNIAERGHYAALVASTLNIGAGAVYKAMEAASKDAKGAGRAIKGILAIRGSNLAERTIIKVILTHPDLYSEKVQEAINRFRDPLLKEVGGIISATLGKARGIDPSELLDELEDNESKALVSGFLLKDSGFIESPSRMLEDCIKKVTGAGRLKETTERFLKALEDKGREDVARQIRARVKNDVPVKKA